jgi:hypothetical protein
MKLLISRSVTSARFRCLRRIAPLATSIRLLYGVLRHGGYIYELQTKHSILRSRYGPQNLDRIDQATAEIDGREIANTINVKAQFDWPRFLFDSG